MTEDPDTPIMVLVSFCIEDVCFDAEMIQASNLLTWRREIHGEIENCEGRGISLKIRVLEEEGSE